MLRALRLAAVATTLFVAACAHDTTPTAGLDADLANVSIDPSVGATSGQASLPGLAMAPDPTYQGALSGTEQCSYSPTTKRVECAPVTRDGLTITRSIAFYDATGAAQTHRDSLTRSTNTQIAVKGSTTTARGVMAVDRTSSMTLSGLGKNATTHTLNGEEKGTTSGTVKTDNGSSATITESFLTTTVNVVVPAPFTATSWPSSGTTTRTSTSTITRGSATRTIAASEQATYNGTSKVTVVVTRAGSTRTCIRDLSLHTMTCP